jgi:hypothetical protein
MPPPPWRSGWLRCIRLWARANDWRARLDPIVFQGETQTGAASEWGQTSQQISGRCCDPTALRRHDDRLALPEIFSAGTKVG